MPGSSTTGRCNVVMVALMRDDTELFKRFNDDEGFKRWLTDTVFGLAYEQAGLR